MGERVPNQPTFTIGGSHPTTTEPQPHSVSGCHANHMIPTEQKLLKITTFSRYATLVYDKICLMI